MRSGSEHPVVEIKRPEPAVVVTVATNVRVRFAAAGMDTRASESPETDDRD
jgi:hypothetical protein